MKQSFIFSLIFIVVFFPVLPVLPQGESIARAATETVGVVRQNCTGASNCYTSLSAWEAAYGGINFGACALGDLVCADKIAVAQIDGVWTTPDTSAVMIDGWETDVSHYIKIYTTSQARHKGILRSNGNYTGYTLQTTSGSSLRSYEEYVKIEGIAIDNTSSGTYDSGFRMSVNNDASENIISNSIIKRTNGGSSYGAVSKDFYYGRYKVINSIIYIDNIPGAGIRGAGSSSYVEVYNSTIYGYGLNTGIKSAVSQNNIVANFAQNFSDSSGDYNCSTDSSAPGVNSLQNRKVSQIAFISLISQNEDFHLGINSVCADHGKALSIFSDDIDSQNRTGQWDIGVDEIGAPVITPSDKIAPVVFITDPLNNSTISRIVNVFASATDNIGVAGVQFKIDGINIGSEDTLSPFSATLDTANFTNFSHLLTAVARDASGNTTVSSQVSITINNQITPTPSDFCSDTNILCVNATTGATQEYTTIQAAADAAKPGNIVYVYDGIYSGFGVSVSGTKTSSISFIAKGNNVIINSGGATGDGVRIQNASYIKIEGFNIKNTNERCIAAKGATPTSPMQEIVIMNNTCDNAGKEGFYLSQTANSKIENNNITNSGAVQATKNHGIYLANAGSDNTIIRGNTVSGARGIGSEGIHINGDLSVGGDGIIINLLIENNIVSNNSTNGFSLDGVYDSLIQNNIVFGNGRHAFRGYKGDGAGGPKNLKIINNTFLAKTDGWAIKLSEDFGGHIIFNNILLSDSGVNGSISVSNPNFSSNYNAFTNRFSIDGELTIVNLAKFQSLGYDKNSFLSSAANIFVNNLLNDYHIKNDSVTVDAGISALHTVAAPLLDISGVQRPQGLKYDMGVYENSITIVSTPTNLTAAAISESQINLEWTPSLGSVSGYKIFRCQGIGCDPTVGIGTSGVNSYLDNTLQPLTSYTYKVSAYDSAGNNSSFSNTVLATTKDTGAIIIQDTDAYYISPTGSDLNSGKASSPFQTFKYAFSKMKSGGTLIVKDGTYNQVMGEWKWQNGVKVPTSVPPNGTALKYTTVKAENVRAVVNGIQIMGSSYIKIKGFKVLNGVNIDGSDHILAQEIGVKGGFATSRSSYITKEDVWSWGSNRYVIHNYQSDHVIDNRVIARLDDLGTIADLPSGAISHYLTNNSIIANALLFDVSGTFSQPYDLVYSSRPSVGNDQIVGLIGFNAGTQLGGIYPADGAGSNYEVRNSVIWGTSKRCIRFNASSPLKVINNTCGENGGDGVDTSGAAVEVKNNIFYNNNGGIVGPISVCDNNLFYKSGVIPSLCTVIYTGDPGIKWLPRSPIPGKGANIEKKYGIIEVNGKFVATETSENLWPWPYEDLIKQDMCEGTTKGLCGTDKTLTKYVWEYLGNPCPQDICDAQTLVDKQIPIVPANFQASDIPLSQKEVSVNETNLKEATLIKSSGDPRVYQLIDGRRLYVPSGKAFTQAGNKWQDVVEVLPQEVAAFPRVSLIKSPNEFTVFYLTEAGQKRALKNANVFTSYGNKWEDVKTISPSILNEYPDVAFIKLYGTLRAYKIENGKKRALTAQAIKRLNVNIVNVAPVNKVEFNAYPNGPTIR